MSNDVLVLSVLFSDCFFPPLMEYLSDLDPTEDSRLIIKRPARVCCLLITSLTIRHESYIPSCFHPWFPATNFSLMSFNATFNPVFALFLS